MTPNPLPDINSGLFDNDFSFQGKPTSPSVALGKPTGRIDPSFPPGSLPHIDELLHALSKYNHSKSASSAPALSESFSSASSPDIFDNTSVRGVSDSSASLIKLTSEEVYFAFLSNLDSTYRDSESCAYSGRFEW